MSDKETSTPRTFKQGLALGATLVLVLSFVTLSMIVWAPDLVRPLEAIGDHAYKPWVYFLPAMLIVGAFPVLFAGYRTPDALAGLLVGAVVGLVSGIAVVFGLIMMSLPNMRY